MKPSPKDRSPRRPSPPRRFLDAAVRKALKLPTTPLDVTAETDVAVPMRDGSTLLVDHLAPVGDAKGTLLIRSPYGWNPITTAAFGTLFAGHGYHVVLARTRGTFGSEGVFEPAVHEVDDGADTVAWLRQQPWFEGRFATLGGSYFGFTQWAILTDPPAELVTAIVWAGPHDLQHALHAEGAFNLELALTWSEQLTFQEDYGFLRTFARSTTVAKRVEPALTTLPVADAADTITGGRWAWFREWATRRDPADPFWEGYQLGAALERVEVPIMLAGGWQDIFLPDTLHQYNVLTRRGVDVALTVGPWTHDELGVKGAQVLLPEALDWLDHHFAGRALERSSAVRVQLAGATDRWRELDVWPPEAQVRRFHLDPEGVLTDVPSPGAEEVSFTYDPADPTPSIGGRMLTGSRSGFRDDSALRRRGDVIVLDSAELAAPMEVVGRPEVTLVHAADTPSSDLWVRLSDVAPDGTSHHVSDGFVRRGDGGTQATLQIPFDAVAYRFAAGHRARLVIGGGAFPHYERNLGTGEHPGTSAGLRQTLHTVGFSASALELPVVASAD